MAEPKLTLNWIFLIAAAIMSLYLLKPLLTAIVFAAVAAIFFMPIHDRLKQKISENGSAAILTAFVVFILLFSVFIGIRLVLTEFAKIYTFIASVDYHQYISAEMLKTLEDVVRLILTKVISSLSNLISQLPRIFLSLFIFFVTFFFFLKDGRKIYSWTSRNLPIPAKKKDETLNELKIYARAFIRVWIIVGLVQAIATTAIFILLGLPYALLAGVVSFILSVLPMIGAYTLYIVVGAALILQGNPVTAVILLAYGLPLSLALDYLIRPYFAGKLSAVHPLIVLLGVFGGVASIGLSGIILGPIILLVVMTLVKTGSVGNSTIKNAIEK